jgi:hypothetical protein
MNASTSINPPAAKLVEARGADDGGMNRFAALLDRLAYEPGRNAKLRLIAEYLRSTPDPERGWALAALTGALSFVHAKPGIVRALIAQRVDPVLFEMSHDFVGDLSETVALMWPRPGSASALRTASLSEVVTTLAVLGKLDLPAQLAQWLDALDETGRWAMLKLVTGALRIGVSARLAKTAVAALGNKDPNEVELIWPTQTPPYPDLFAWLEGRADKPTTSDPAPFRPVMLAPCARERRAWEARSGGVYRGMEVGRHPRASCSRDAREWPACYSALYPHRRGHIAQLSGSHGGAHLRRCDRRRAVDHARASRAIVQYAAAASQPQDRHAENAQ